VIELVRRDAWGARPPTGKPQTIPTPVADLFLHHSVGQDNGARSVRAIQDFHQKTRQWSDVGYSVLYSPRFRSFFEGRGFGISQAAQRGHNSSAHSVCILGNYETHRLPDTAIEDLRDFGHWHGQTWGPANYRPHRDVSATACPGRNVIDVLERLNDQAIYPLTPALDLPPTLRRGDTGDDVRLLQAAVMPHDGVYSPQTIDAVQVWQARHGLKVDGICGPQTWASILRA